MGSLSACPQCFAFTQLIVYCATQSRLCIQGSWEKKLIERVHNVAKAGKKRASQSSAPSAKRGRPKQENPIFQRYPAVEFGQHADENQVQALQKELEKEKPRKDVVLPLLKQTFPERRQYILSTHASVVELTERYRALILPYAVS